MRRALEHSRNVPAIRLMDALGPEAGHRLRAPLRADRAAAAVPADRARRREETLLEMTSAYSVFPNQGVRMAPYSILKVTDREGNLLEENRPEPQDAIRADTAYVMTSLLRGVVEHGTAVKAAALNWPVAGKTGTTDDFSDAWFIGFDPDITLGVWVGYDQKKPLGQGMSGAEVALPIWIDIFKAWIGDRKDAAEVRGARQHRVRRGRQAPGTVTERHAGRDHRSLHRRHAARVDPTVANCRLAIADADLRIADWRLLIGADCGLGNRIVPHLQPAWARFAQGWARISARI